MKQAGTSKRTRWHQDQPFYWIDGTQVCVLWWPLDPIRRENSLELVKGSHRWGQWFAPELSRYGQDLYARQGAHFERMPDIEARRDDYEILSFEMEPGDAIAFHGLIVHGAPGNADAVQRRALSTIWMGDDARYGERPSARPAALPRPRSEAGRAHGQHLLPAGVAPRGTYRGGAPPPLQRPRPAHHQLGPTAAVPAAPRAAPLVVRRLRPAMRAG